MSDEKVAIFTMRMSDSVPVPPWLGESHIGKCSLCKEPVWITSTTIPRMEEYPNHDIVCNVCAPGVLARVEEPEFVSADPELQEFADENHDDIVEWLKRRGRG